MIILDEEDPGTKLSSYLNVAGPTLRLPERAARSASPLTLPDYETSQALANYDQDLDYRKNIKSNVDHRFWKATLYAFLIYIACSLVVGIPIIVTKLKHHNFVAPPPWQQGNVMSGPSNTTSIAGISGGTPICNSWSTMSVDSSTKQFVASLSYSLSALGQFAIRSNVSEDSDETSYTFGSLTVAMNPDNTATSAVLSVIMETTTKALADLGEVCVTQSFSACDLSIRVPSQVGPSESFQFTIDLLLPHSESSYTVSEIGTWLPSFNQTFKSIDKNIYFDKLSIKGPMSQFDAGYIQANQLLVQTSMASITGTFQVTETVTLDTVEAPIDASITLYNDGTRRGPTYMNLDTGNGAIDAHVQLLVPEPQGHHPPEFVTSVKTFNGPLSVTVVHDNSTATSQFNLRASNNLASSHVTLDSKYQGTFDLSTKLSTASVKTVNDKGFSVDPTGDHRKWSIDYDHQANTRSYGWIGWGQRPPSWTRNTHQGHVEVITSHHSVTLELDGWS